MISDEELTEKLAELIVEVTKWTPAAEIRKLLYDRYDIDVSTNKVTAILDMMYMDGLLVVRKRSRSGKGLTRFYSIFTRDSTESEVSS